MYKKKFVKKKTRIRFVIFTLALLVMSEIIFLLLGGSFLSRSKEIAKAKNLSRLEIQDYARKILEKCAEQNHHAVCYDEEIPKLMDTISMEDAFEVAKVVQKDDPQYLYCHVLAHKLSARELQKDFTKWTEIIPRCPLGVCANGCQHGVMQELVRNEILSDTQIETLKPDLQSVCEESDSWKPTRFEQAHCYHGLGHMFLYITNADTSKASILCDEIGKKKDGRNFSSLCHQGLFMQLFQPIEPEDFTLVAGKQPKKEELMAFCRKFGSGQKAEDCWIEGWPLYRDEIATPLGTTDFCFVFNDARSQDRCFQQLFYGYAQLNNFNSEKIQRFCDGVPAQRKGECLSDGASSMIQAESNMIEKAGNLCKSVEDKNVGNACYEGLVDTAFYTYNIGSKEIGRICKLLPSPLKEKCVKKSDS